MPVTEEQVYEALRDCYDPEIPVNVVDLGLIYEVKIIDDWVGVKMTLTAPGCPAHSFISQNVQSRLKKIPGVEKADVINVVFNHHQTVYPSTESEADPLFWIHSRGFEYIWMDHSPAQNFKPLALEFNINLN